MLSNNYIIHEINTFSAIYPILFRFKFIKKRDCLIWILIVDKFDLIFSSNINMSNESSMQNQLKFFPPRFIKLSMKFENYSSTKGLDK